FMLQNNLWGRSAALAGGSQTSQITAVNGDKVAWQTSYEWAGGGFRHERRYANLDLRVGINKPLSSITSIPAAWNYTYAFASCDLVADVSFDLWLSNMANTAGATSSSTFEIMIWLSARGGAGPIGYQVDSKTINGVTWGVFKGTVSNWTVFSFVASDEITSFKQDLKPFFTYLINKQNVPSSHYLVQAQAGTEPFTGECFNSSPGCRY
ncbi:glycoside hydrolase family 12 protein, partial [Hebeloma cylindrosporum]